MDWDVVEDYLKRSDQKMVGDLCKDIDNILFFVSTISRLCVHRELSVL